MLAKIIHFVKRYKKDIFLFLALFLSLTLSFSIGYIVAKIEEKEPLLFEVPQIEEDTIQ